VIKLALISLVQRILLTSMRAGWQKTRQTNHLLGYPCFIKRRIRGNLARSTSIKTAWTDPPDVGCVHTGGGSEI
jgi:hypothetical protein